MFTMVSVGIYASILWVLGVLVIRERRRTRYIGRIKTGLLPGAMSPHDRP